MATKKIPGEDIHSLRNRAEDLEKELEFVKSRFNALKKAKQSVIIEKKTEYIDQAGAKLAEEEQEPEPDDKIMKRLAEKKEKEEQEALSAEQQEALEKYIEQLRDELGEKKKLIQAMKTERQEGMKEINEIKTRFQEELLKIYERIDVKNKRKLDFNKINPKLFSTEIEELPPGWEKLFSIRKEQYYYLNVHTKETQWDVPKIPAPTVTKVRASHILVKHKNSKRPFSRQDKTNQITRSEDEALDLLLTYKNQILVGGEKFEDVAAKHSDCNSAVKGGDLGVISHGKMNKLIEDAAFSLNVGEISKPIWTDSGVHIVKRTE